MIALMVVNRANIARVQMNDLMQNSTFSKTGVREGNLLMDGVELIVGNDEHR